MRFNLQQEYLEACEQVNRLAQTLKERDTEVERLKTENAMMTEQAFKFRDLCVEKDQLITELAEVLDRPAGKTWQYKETLVRRARGGEHMSDDHSDKCSTLLR
jgi:hypothetical protein